MKIYTVYKKLGATPLEALLAFKKKNKISDFERLTYAGRLDPMAKGLLVLLSGASQKQKEKIQNLKKTYQAQILVGFNTDTGDLLGLVKNSKQKFFTKTEIQTALNKYSGKIALPLPAYASARHKRQALFALARQGYFERHPTPKKQMQFFACRLKKIKKISATQLKAYLQKNLPKVNGDFRQKLIIKKWQNFLQNPRKEYQLLSLFVSCSGGTYIRSLAQDLGKELNCPCCLFLLTRTAVGKYQTNMV